MLFAHHGSALYDTNQRVSVPGGSHRLAVVQSPLPTRL